MDYFHSLLLTPAFQIHAQTISLKVKMKTIPSFYYEILILEPVLGLIQKQNVL